jgi:hypothetical protein
MDSDGLGGVSLDITGEHESESQGIRRNARAGRVDDRLREVRGRDAEPDLLDGFYKAYARRVLLAEDRKAARRRPRSGLVR